MVYMLKLIHEGINYFSFNAHGKIKKLRGFFSL